MLKPMEGHQVYGVIYALTWWGWLKNVKLVSGCWKIVKNCWRMHTSKFPGGPVKNKAIEALFLIFNKVESRIYAKPPRLPKSIYRRFSFYFVITFISSLCKSPSAHLSPKIRRRQSFFCKFCLILSTIF